MNAAKTAGRLSAGETYDVEIGGLPFVVRVESTGVAVCAVNDHGEDMGQVFLEFFRNGLTGHLYRGDRDDGPFLSEPLSDDVRAAREKKIWGGE